MASIPDRPTLQIGPAPETDSSGVGQKLSAEAQLLASLPSTIGGGIAASAEDAWNHKGRTILEGASAVVLGAAFSLLSENPKPLIAGITTWAGRGFLGVAAADLGLRFGEPMYDVWQHTSHLQADKTALGNNVGNAVFNYGLAIGEGGLGAKLGQKFIAPTKFGSMLQGFTERTVDGSTLNDPVENHNIPGTVHPATPDDLPANAPTFQGKVKLRTFSDGSQLAFDKNNVVISTTDGSHAWFTHKQTVLGRGDRLDLQRVVRMAPDDPQPGSLHSADYFLSRGKFAENLSTDPPSYPRPPGQAYDLPDGLKFLTTGSQRVVEVDTPGGRLFSPQRGAWKFSGSGIANLNTEALMDAASSAVPKAGTIGTVSAPKLDNIDLLKMTNTARPYQKSFEAALGQMMIERGADIGTGIVEHKLIQYGEQQ